MELISDGLLIATALTAGLYCLVLGRRLRRLNDSGSGIGAQIEALDSAIAETRAALAETRSGVTELRDSARAAMRRLAEDAARGEAVAARVAQEADHANEILRRLYDAGSLVEAHIGRSGDAAGEYPGDELPEREPVIPVREEGGPPEQVSGPPAESAGDPIGGGEIRRQVALPEPVSGGPEQAVPGPGEEAGAAHGGSAGTAGVQTRKVLRAERVTL